MEFHNLLDPASAVIVVGGTLVATLLRCGMSESGAALGALIGLGRRRFDAARARAELAIQVQDIRRDGLLRAEPHRFGDSEFDAATEALIGHRSLGALHAAHETHRRQRIERNEMAVGTLSQAAELAPVFGLAGTLVSLSQISTAAGTLNFTAAISMAVLTTLYGLLLGNIVFAPLARVVERAARAEEAERQKVVNWLEKQIAPMMPGARHLVAVEAG